MTPYLTNVCSRNYIRGYGIEGRILTWIEAFLTNRRRSSWADVTSGIPQGSVLGHVLFICYINDMPSSVQSSIYLLAEDAKLYRNIASDDDPLHSSTTFSNWRNGQRNGSCISTQASVRSCTLATKTQTETTPWAQQHWLHATTSEKDLGVYVDTGLTFEKHIETVVNQANRMIVLIRRSYTYLDSQSLLKLYTSLVRPTLEYANAAWTPILRRDQILLENVQRRAPKLIPELRDRDYTRTGYAH